MTVKVERVGDLGLLWLRIMVGLGIAHHGFGKIFGGRMEGFAAGLDSTGFPAEMFFAWVAALIELCGGALLVVGLFTRFAAFLVFTTMCVAAFIFHRHDPFAAKELALCYLTMSGTLILTGAGRASIDATIRG